MNNKKSTAVRFPHSSFTNTTLNNTSSTNGSSNTSNINTLRLGRQTIQDSKIPRLGSETFQKGIDSKLKK
jgi:hypothetical protein